MSLQRKAQRQLLSTGVVEIQHIHRDNSMLEYIGFRLLELDKGAIFQQKLEQQELCIVVLTGTIELEILGQTYRGLGQRASVFERKPTDSIYIGSGSSYHVRAEGVGVKLALCYAFSDQNLPYQIIYAQDNHVEHRGKYQNQRLVHNILPDTHLGVQNLLVVEVYTDGGNFSSYPPHKHDEDRLPEESLLEESYYHEIDPPQGFLFQRVYTDDRSLDESMAVEHQSVVLVPRGYHPVGVCDGYRSYYLNVMAGPRRIWKFHNDPAHEWIIHRT